MTSTFQRQPLAVMFTDIKGYTSLTSKDEILALSLVDKKRGILEPQLVILGWLVLLELYKEYFKVN